MIVIALKSPSVACLLLLLLASAFALPTSQLCPLGKLSSINKISQQHRLRQQPIPLTYQPEQEAGTKALKEAPQEHDQTTTTTTKSWPASWPTKSFGAATLKTHFSGLKTKLAPDVDRPAVKLPQETTWTEQVQQRQQQQIQQQQQQDSDQSRDQQSLAQQHSGAGDVGNQQSHASVSSDWQRQQVAPAASPSQTPISSLPASAPSAPPTQTTLTSSPANAGSAPLTQITSPPSNAQAATNATQSTGPADSQAGFEHQA